MTIQFMGVRGSLPSPGPDTVRFGGNTSCVRVDVDAQNTILLDAGTGIVQAGLDLEPTSRQIVILLTHLHWDHIQGLPFFKPLYQRDRPVEIRVADEAWIRPLMATMDGSLHCPVSFEDLPARVSITADQIEAPVGGSSVSITRIAANHPGGCVGYRIDSGKAAMVYLPDNELGVQDGRSLADFASFCDNADLLVHDAQYTQAEMPHRAGWGHSMVSEACLLAQTAGVRSLALFHHDPWRTDDELATIERDAHRHLEGSAVRVLAAAEGASLSLG